MLIPPKAFLDDVKAEIVKLNKKPKIVHKVLISQKQYGGLFQNKDRAHNVNYSGFIMLTVKKLPKCKMF